MRWLICPLVAIVAAVVGGFAFMFVGEIASAFLDEFAPGYFPGVYPVFLGDKHFTIEDARKIGWGELLGDYGITGAATIGVTTLFIMALRLGGFMSMLRAYMIICLSGFAGACAGGGIGYLLGTAAPGYYRGVFRAGGETWFDPIQVGIGLGVSQGLPVGLAIGSLIVVVVAWSRSRNLGAVGV